MRKLILTVLLATSAAMPTMAQDRDFGGRHRGGSGHESSEQRAAAREARQAQRAERAERPQRAERVQREQPQLEQQQAQQLAVQQARSERRGDQRRGDGGRSYRDAQRQSYASPYAGNGQVLSQQRDIRRTRSRSIIGQVIEQDRERRGEVVVQRDRDRRDSSRYSGGSRQWSHQWRGDRNYDWRHYRDRNRSVFRLGNYWDPYGSSYRRFSIGFSLFPNYYQSNYWLDDPWMYRLPPAYGPYRWVRYYDDALLVNIYTGQVVDVVYSFFW
jgi:hypothetical protein